MILVGTGNGLQIRWGLAAQQFDSALRTENTFSFTKPLFYCTYKITLYLRSSSELKINLFYV